MEDQRATQGTVADKLEASSSLSMQGKFELVDQTRHDERLDAESEAGFAVVRSEQGLRHPHIFVSVSAHLKFDNMVL